MTTAEHNNEPYCPECDNHCPIDQLRCGKGRRHFGVPGENHSPSAPDGSLAGLLQQCGRFVHHGGHSMGNQELFQALTEAEQASLRALLGKLAASWQKCFGSDCLDHHHKHGGHGDGKHRHTHG